jgi:hypothetical protein
MTLGSNSGLSIGTPSAAPSQGLLVQGLSNLTGNVGIGAAARTDTALVINNTNANNELTFVGNNFTNIYSETTSGIQFGITTTGNSAAIEFLTNNQTKLTLASTGLASFTNNVGIGTAARSDTGLTIINSADNNELTFGGTAFTNIFSETTLGIQFGIVSSGNSAGIEFLTNNSPRLTIASTGAATFSNSVNVNREGSYIGIDAQANPRLGFVKLSGAQPFLGFAQDAFTIKVSSGSTIDISNTFSTALTIDTSRAATFSSSVTANARSFIKGSAGYLFDVEEQGSNKARFQSYVASNEVSLVAGYDTTAVPMTFYTGNSEKMRITAAGRVLIGTPPPTESNFQLDVNGGARFTNTTWIQNGSFSVIDNNLPQQYFRADLIPTNGRTIGTLNYGARFNSTTYGTGASIDATAAGTWSSTNYGTNLIFSTATENTDVNTARLIIAASGTVRITNLAGSGSRMVVSDANGVLSTQAIGSGAITGSGTSGQVAFFNGTSTITSESNLIWDAANDRLGIGPNTPNFKLNVFDVGVVITSSQANWSSNTRGIMVDNTNNGDESVGVWFRTGGNHLSGITGQRTNSAADWSTDLRFFTHPTATTNLTSAFERMRITAEGNLLINTTDNSGGERIRNAGTIFTDAIVTMRPASTTVKSDVWKLGRAALATNSDPYDRIIRVQIAGTLYDILAIDKGAA